MINLKKLCVYDIETYPNVFTLCAKIGSMWFQYEISERRNDSFQIVQFMDILRSSGYSMVGFNNLGFDYPVMHMLYRMKEATARALYDKAQSIFFSQSEDNDKWVHTVKSSDMIVPQIDLFKIHHFDNKARMTSLKTLEFNMRSGSVEDLPFAPGTCLQPYQIDTLRKYNRHDVEETAKFLDLSLDKLRFRIDLSAKYDRDFINHNDTKIGKDYFVMQLEKAGIQCYNYSDKGRTPRQTVRPVIHLKDAILPWIKFDIAEFQRVLDWMKCQSITETKGVFKDVTAIVCGFEYVFGLGGIHGSINDKIIHSDDEHALIDIDVEAYYPSTAIVQKFKPAHYPEKFCQIYADLKAQRQSYKKGTNENAMLKLAINGVYGDSNQKFSVFYDPLMTMSITLNGQLLLCLLAESIILKGVGNIIQINTDGMTVKVPRKCIDLFRGVVANWENMTGLKMEENQYQSMFIRDVNNYIALYTNGKVKRKGAYEHDLDWHQNHSALVIPKVAEKVLVENALIRETVINWPDTMDFMLRTKVPRSSKLLHGDQLIQNNSRYYVSINGNQLTKKMPPLPKKPDEWRFIGIESGWKTTIANVVSDDVMQTMKHNINYEYYIQEVEKLCLQLA